MDITTIDGYEDFARSLRKKAVLERLRQEIEGLSPSEQDGYRNRSRFIREKQWEVEREIGERARRLLDKMME